jgi:hypothetical protein
MSRNICDKHFSVSSNMCDRYITPLGVWRLHLCQMCNPFRELRDELVVHLLVVAQHEALLWTFKEHSMNIQGTFKEYSRNIQATFKRRSPFWRTARWTCGSCPGRRLVWSTLGNIQGTFKEHSSNIQGTFKEHSSDIHLFGELRDGLVVHLLVVV